MLPVKHSNPIANELRADYELPRLQLAIARRVLKVIADGEASDAVRAAANGLADMDRAASVAPGQPATAWGRSARGLRCCGDL